mgnify:CR=1 FL=1
MVRYEDIQAGDTVYFSTPHSKEVKGKAVMFGPAGWVVNMGGRFGTPGIVLSLIHIFEPTRPERIGFSGVGF